MSSLLQTNITFSVSILKKAIQAEIISIVIPEHTMNRKVSAVTGEMKTREVKVDPGNLMLVIYTLVIALTILCGGLLQADGSVRPADKLELLSIEDDHDPGGISAAGLRRPADL